MSEWNDANYTYILLCADGSYYTGWTNNLKRRVESHNRGTASRYTRSRRPVKLVYYEKYATRHEAMSREVYIKQMTHEEKYRMVINKMMSIEGQNVDNLPEEILPADEK